MSADPAERNLDALITRKRPPWNQELTYDEAQTMLAAARAVGGEVESWAVNVYYVQSSLAHNVWQLEVQLARTKKRWDNARRVRRELRAELSRLRERERTLEEALDRGRRFERTYQESLGATWTMTQQDRLDSLQSAFLDAYLDVLAGSEGRNKQEDSG